MSFRPLREKTALLLLQKETLEEDIKNRRAGMTPVCTAERNDRPPTKLLDNPQKAHSSTISLFAYGTSRQRHTLAEGLRAHLCKISAAQLDVENASGLSQDTDTGIFTDVAGILILPSGLQLLERGIYSCDLSLVGFGISNLYRR